MILFLYLLFTRARVCVLFCLRHELKPVHGCRVGPALINSVTVKGKSLFFESVQASEKHARVRQPPQNLRRTSLLLNATPPSDECVVYELIRPRLNQRNKSAGAGSSCFCCVSLLKSSVLGELSGSRQKNNRFAHTFAVPHTTVHDSASRDS